eukprot:CAMPEP_0170359926 /NCGR_PEP_ID=MMETSP0117_2-20130122/3009_1 /TAXON_ID=400756 /ORGANISM="Durinskia baltica, Strain CSIRO CS-38" /LENGTH=116 /DNA_ID=CAMNT_0010614209 /DNA_START=231 /DNA_END=581 /DNA_ORIENTATION=-
MLCDRLERAVCVLGRQSRLRGQMLQARIVCPDALLGHEVAALVALDLRGRVLEELAEADAGIPNGEAHRVAVAQNEAAPRRQPVLHQDVGNELHAAPDFATRGRRGELSCGASEAS